MFEKADEKVRILLNYQDDKKATSFSNVKADATAEDIYDTAVAINSLQLDTELDKVQKIHSYALNFVMNG